MDWIVIIALSFSVVSIIVSGFFFYVGVKRKSRQGIIQTIASNEISKQEISLNLLSFTIAAENNDDTLKMVLKSIIEDGDFDETDKKKFTSIENQSSADKAKKNVT